MYLSKNRKQNRWSGYDYKMSGLYFVTICTKNRIECLGKIENDKIILNDFGRIIVECWQDLPKHYKNCYPDEFMVMPNHFHGIIEISKNENNFGDKNVGTGFKPVPTEHGLSEIIRGFKTFSSRHINESQNNFHFAWQRSFHDRVIRTEQELIDIREYIKNNATNWAEDRNNPINNK